MIRGPLLFPRTAPGLPSHPSPVAIALPPNMPHPLVTPLPPRGPRHMTVNGISSLVSAGRRLHHARSQHLCPLWQFWLVFIQRAWHGLLCLWLWTIPTTARRPYSNHQSIQSEHVDPDPEALSSAFYVYYEVVLLISEAFFFLSSRFWNLLKSEWCIGFGSALAEKLWARNSRKPTACIRPQGWAGINKLINKDIYIYI